ncbi:MAG: segregation and condensation protein A [Phycisphaerae bacterium]
MPEYRVQTDIYHGPLDLLLYLIKRDEIDLYDIPVARITEQYCRYIEMLKVIDPNVAGDFLVMATVLMELKSRMLLPRPVSEEDEPDDLTDPRLELVRQLLEYKKFKDASFELRDAQVEQAHRWPRVPAQSKTPDTAEERTTDLEDVQIWDLVAAFNTLMSAIGAGHAVHEVVMDDTPMASHATAILEQIQREGGDLSFETLFTNRTRAEMIGMFLAILELMRQTRIRVVQESPHGPIVIHLISAEPIEVGESWGPAFHEAVLGTQDTAAEELQPGPPADSIEHDPADNKTNVENNPADASNACPLESSEDHPES